jgi:dihydroflavonol-4-reductase
VRAAITGASGLVGGNLARELVRQGYAVRAIRRSPASIAHLAAEPIEWLPGDLDDIASLGAAFDGADVVFHCAALVTLDPAPTEALVKANVAGTRNVLEAVHSARVPRLVHCSSVVAVGLSENGQPSDESARFNFEEHGLADGYTVTKRQSEDLVRDAARDGIDAVIVNPTYMLGPYDAKPSSGKMIVGVVQGQSPGYTTGANNFVDVRDVARGMILAWQKGQRGERYILGGHNLPYKEIFARIANVAGIAPLTWSVPWPLAYAAGLFGDLQQWVTGKEPLINSGAVRWGYTSTFQFSSAKAERELGYTYGPIEPAIDDAIAWFRAQGILRTH